MKIYIPTITYQYSSEGQLDQGAPTSFEFTLDVRERFRASFRAWYPNHPRAFGRLQELLRESLERLPDNPYAQRDAWLAGVTDEQNSHVRAWFDSYAAEREEAERKTEADRRRDQRRRTFEAQLEVRVTGRIHEAGGEGPGSETTGETVEVRDRATGETLRFAVRNIFDFGRVINPLYSIAPGRTSGITNRDDAGRYYWMSFEGDQGWQRVRDLTAIETAAIQYLQEFSSVAEEVRL